MIAGRLHWKRPAARRSRARSGSPPSTSPTGTLTPDRGGHEAARVAPPACAARTALRDARSAAGSRCSTPTSPTFRAALARENHTLKRALTDPRLFSGIGNAYSDEILHARGCRPLKLTTPARRRGDRAALSTRRATRSPSGPIGCARTRRRPSPRRSPRSARAWRCTAATASPARSAARRCSASSTPRTRPTTAPAARRAGDLLADRALSRLLKEDWPRTIEDWELRRGAGVIPGDAAHTLFGRCQNRDLPSTRE